MAVWSRSTVGTYLALRWNRTWPRERGAGRCRAGRAGAPRPRGTNPAASIPHQGKGYAPEERLHAGGETGEVLAHAGSWHRIGQEHGDGHGPHTAWHGRNPARDLAGRFEVDVALQAAVFQAVDAHVDNGRARLDPVGLHHARPAHGGYQNIGFTANGRKITSARVA